MTHAEHLQHLLSTIDRKLLVNIKAHTMFHVPIEDIAEAYIEAFRSLDNVYGIETPHGTQFLAFHSNGRRWIVNSNAIKFHNALLDAAEDEGWDIEEMALLDSRDVEEMG